MSSRNVTAPLVQAAAGRGAGILRIKGKQHHFIALRRAHLGDGLCGKRMPVAHGHETMRVQTAFRQFQLQSPRLLLGKSPDGRSIRRSPRNDAELSCARVLEINLASGLRPMRAKGKSIISGSQNKLKRNGSMASSESGPPSWKRTTPIRRVECAIPRDSLEREQRMLLNRGGVNAELKVCSREYEQKGSTERRHYAREDSARFGRWSRFPSLSMIEIGELGRAGFAADIAGQLVAVAINILQRIADLAAPLQFSPDAAASAGRNSEISAVGLAMFLPAMSGAEPCTASKIAQ